jgi:hypothetical protein
MIDLKWKPILIISKSFLDEFGNRWVISPDPEQYDDLIMKRHMNDLKYCTVCGKEKIEMLKRIQPKKSSK